MAGENESAIAVFSRNPDYGALTWQSVIGYGDEGVAGMLSPQALGLSADDQYLYALGYGDHSVVVFARGSAADTASNGDLTAVENIIDGYDGVSGLKGPTDIAIAGDDSNVYVTAFIDNSVAILKRLAEVIFSSSFE